MNNPLSGLRYFLRGFVLIFTPGLRRFVIVPLLINIALFIGLFILAFHYYGELNQWFMHFLPAWLHWLAMVLWLFFFISFFIVFVYAFVTVGNLLAAPFNSFLAEKVELHLTGKLHDQRSLAENIRDIPRIVGRQVSIMGYYFPRALLLLLLFFIPAFQPVAAIIWFLFSAWYLSLTYLDYITDNHRVPISDVRAWQKSRKLASLEFGVCVLLASMIPVINFFSIPAAVAGATCFWLEQNRE